MRRRVRATAPIAARFVSLPAGIERARSWAGLRPLTPDGLPMIGRSARVDNLILATGHGHDDDLRRLGDPCRQVDLKNHVQRFKIVKGFAEARRNRK